jgi:sugar phosphate isomerase/epimerase
MSDALPHEQGPGPLWAYTETSLPGDTLADRLTRAKALGLAIEAVHREAFPIAQVRDAGVDIATVQAYGMHDFHPLHRDPAIRDAALPYLHEAIQFTGRLGVSRLVVVCGFGSDLADHPLERAIAFFEQAIPAAREAGVRLLIEPLSPRRCAALHDPEAIGQLIETLDCPDALSMVLDTGHLLDSGWDLDEFFTHWKRPVVELQLKGRDSAPPSPSSPVARWLRSLPQMPDVISIEHRQPITPQRGEDLVRALRDGLMINPDHRPNPS